MDAPLPLPQVATWRVGRGLVACSCVAVVLLSALFLALPFALMLTWRLAPAHVRAVQPLQFDYRYAAPQADMILPRPIPRGQRYRASVALTLPESDHNRGLGIFQVTVQALSSDGKVLAQASWPCMLKFQSFALRLVRSALLVVPLLAGVVEERQTLRLPPLKATEGTLFSTSTFRVLLEPKAGLPPALGLPELYAAELEVTSSPSGLTGWLRFWRLTAVVWALVILFFGEILLLLLCCRRALLPKFGGRGGGQARGRPQAPVAHEIAGAAEALVREKVGEAEEPPSLDVSDIEDEVMEVGKPMNKEFVSELRRRTVRGENGTVTEENLRRVKEGGGRPSFSSWEDEEDDELGSVNLEGGGSSGLNLKGLESRSLTARDLGFPESLELEDSREFDSKWIKTGLKRGDGEESEWTLEGGEEDEGEGEDRGWKQRENGHADVAMK